MLTGVMMPWKSEWPNASLTAPVRLVSYLASPSPRLAAFVYFRPIDLPLPPLTPTTEDHDGGLDSPAAATDELPTRPPFKVSLRVSFLGLSGANVPSPANF